MLSISATEAWHAAFPGAFIGLLELSGLDPHAPSVPHLALLGERKRQIEARLREHYAGFTRADFLALPVMAAYDRYYTRFKKTYHLQLQLESIVLKGKSLPDLSPGVDANFMAEMHSLVNTAGHDVAKLRVPVVIDVSREEESMTQMNGSVKQIRAGDMVTRDADGISCSLIYGQDSRSPMSLQTTHALYVAYAPAGVPADTVTAQLKGIEEHVRLVSPGVTVEQMRLITSE